MAKIFSLGENKRGERVVGLVAAALNRQQVVQRGSQKEIQRIPTSWGSFEYRLRVLNALDISTRSFRINEFQNQRFFEVTFFKHEPLNSGTKLHYLVDEESYAVDDIVAWLAQGRVPLESEAGRHAFLDWTNERDPQRTIHVA